MSNPRHWASNLLPRAAISRRLESRRAKSSRRTPSAKRRRLRLFQSLEPRVVLAALAWYPLDEVSGTGVADNSGNANHGTLTGGAWADGQIDGAIEFDADGNISVPATAFGTVDQEVSFAFWAYGGGTQPAVDSILYGVNAAEDRVFNVHLPFSNSKIYWDAGGVGGYDRIFKNADPLVFKDSWHHWAFTKNAATGSMKIYLDGDSWHSGTGNTKSMAGVTSFVLGAETDGSITSNGYDGLLDDVRIYDHELTSAEVSGLFTGNPVNNFTANSLAELRAAGTTVNNSIVALSTTGGDPHPVTSVVTPGVYWINGDHIANPTGSEPTFLELGGSNNTYNLAGTSINLDTRKLDGFGRALGHDSGIEVVKISGSDNTINDLTLTGHDLAMDTDPGAQRHADWAGVYVQMIGSNNTVDGADVLTRGSSPYGLGDVFGKGARQFPQGSPPGQVDGEPAGVVGLPWYGHNKTSAFQVIDTVDAVINDMHLDVNTYGHGFFVQGTATNTTLTNSTVTGELFSSNDVIATQLYQDYGFTSHGNVLPADMMISGNEDGVRMYTGASGLTVDNVVVTNMRTGFSVALGRGTMTLNNVEAYGTENAFNFKSNTTITNAKGDITHGPLLHTPYDSASNTSVEVELVGGVPEGVDWAVAYVAGNNLDITIDSNLAAGALPEDSLVRFGQVFFDNWRDSKNPTGPEDHGDKNYDYINSTFHNNTNQMLVLGNEVTSNNGSSQGGVISNGKDNEYDGVTLVINNSHLIVEHINGLGNGGAAADGSLETNATVVADGSTLELQAGIRIVDEKLTITGDGVLGEGALFTDGDGARFGSSSSSDESTIYLDGDASIGVGMAGDELLIGRLEGTGNLTKLGVGSVGVEKSSNLNGNLIVAEGHVTGRSNVVRHGLTIATGASISGISNNTFNTVDDVDVDGQLDVNSRDSSFISNLSGKIGRLNGSGSVTSSNPTTGSGGTLTFDGDGADGLFTGTIDGELSLVKSGANTQAFAGSLTHTRTTTINEGSLIVNGTHTGGGAYTVNSGGTLGGNGSIGSAVMVGAAGHITPGASAGTLSVCDVTLSSGAFFDVEVGGTNAGSEYDRLITDSAVLGGLLSISLLDSVGATYQPLSADTFTVLSSTSLSGTFDNIANGQRLETVGGEGTFLVTYSGTSTTVSLSDFEATELDFGDAPTSYSTLLTNDGARHATVGPQLGSSRDIDSDGVPSVAADGDGNDEDGALFGGIGVLSTVAAVNIELAGASEARVDAWIDFNRDGDWADAGENILSDVLVNSAMSTLNYNVPAGQSVGDTYARVRLSSAGGLSPTGYADDGEVEDYVVSIIEPPVVESIVINQGEAQRSSLDSVQVTFDQVVVIDNSGDGAFKFVDSSSGDVITPTLVIDDSSGKTVVDLTFDQSGPHVTSFGSLQNGDYQLTIDASRVTSLGIGLDGNQDGNYDGSAVDNYQMSAVDGFFRKYGDADGNDSVGLSDFAAFRGTFGLDDNDGGYLRGLDADGDKQIGLADFAAFRSGFGT